jgi:2,4-dienoyl-CoA reductase-like NADH-dependent reductase (Old Yellow Enzyme family)
MNQVFQANELAGLKLKNRIWRSATYEGMGNEDGRPLEKLGEMYVKLAKGGVGAIITGLVGVQQNGRISPHQPMLDRDENVAYFQKITARVKEFGTPIIVQLAHAGGQTSQAATGSDVVGPSKKKYPFYSSVARELSEVEIEAIIGSFTKAIERAKQAGFDGVQLHAAHGYLLSAFLSPRVNRRTDQWGGNTENRFRIIEEIVRGARKTVGKFPILVKYSAYDGDKGGVSIEEGVKIARLLQKAGVDAIEVSCGSSDDGSNATRVTKVPVEAYLHFIPALKKMPFPMKVLFKVIFPLASKKHLPLDNYNVAAAQAIKKQVQIPVIAVGGIRNISDIQNIIAGGKADYVSMCRPFIIEPDIVAKFQTGQQEKAKCISCNYCLLGIAGGQLLKCYHGKV